MASAIDSPYKKPGARTVHGGTGTYEPEVVGPRKSMPKGDQANMSDTSKRNFGKADPKPGPDANKEITDIGFAGANKKSLTVNKKN